MNDNLLESTDIQETQFGGPSPSSKPRLIHFSTGETLEVGDSEDEEDEETFTEHADEAKLSLRTVGRISLRTCDFLGEKLAGLLGLNAAKYQYAFDEYHRDSKNPVRTSGSDVKAAERIHLSPKTGCVYGATSLSPGDPGSRAPDQNCDDKAVGSHNEGYQDDHEH